METHYSCSSSWDLLTIELKKCLKILEKLNVYKFAIAILIIDRIEYIPVARCTLNNVNDNNVQNKSQFSN